MKRNDVHGMLSFCSLLFILFLHPLYAPSWYRRTHSADTQTTSFIYSERLSIDNLVDCTCQPLPTIDSMMDDHDNAAEVQCLGRELWSTMSEEAVAEDFRAVERPLLTQPFLSRNYPRVYKSTTFLNEPVQIDAVKQILHLSGRVISSMMQQLLAKAYLEVSEHNALDALSHSTTVLNTLVDRFCPHLTKPIITAKTVFGEERPIFTKANPCAHIKRPWSLSRVWTIKIANDSVSRSRSGPPGLIYEFP